MTFIGQVKKDGHVITRVQSDLSTVEFSDLPKICVMPFVISIFMIRCLSNRGNLPGIAFRMRGGVRLWRGV